jgi:hypothetical protein
MDRARGVARCVRLDLLDRHVAHACREAAVAVEDLRSLVGDQEFAMLWGSAFEDFLSRDLDDGRNIVDNYLKRRGWKGSPSNRAYMAALRSSVMSLYEVSDIVPGESFLARDLVRGGDAVRISERSATKSLRQPAYRAYTVIKREGQDDFWQALGAAFPHQDGKGFNIVLQALPIDGKIVLRAAGRRSRCNEWWKERQRRQPPRPKGAAGEIATDL